MLKALRKYSMMTPQLSAVKLPSIQNEVMVSLV